MAENYKYLMGETEMDGQREFPFEFSVVMAVYNVEPFLREAVDSLTAQNFGFEKIQLIMVDDGSTDGSGAICDEYAERYPDNVMVIHKENGGLSSARNVGVRASSGRYLNFFDPDDLLDNQVFSSVHDFFANHGHEVDVVSIPLMMFGAVRGPHPSNSKFSKGNRVIDLEVEWWSFQMSLASAFIKADIAKEYCFKEDLTMACAEDSKELIKIFIRNPKLGVVRQGKYRYRKRADSLVGSVKEKSLWYMPYLKDYCRWAIEYSIEQIGCVPKNVQYTIMYDLQWKLRQGRLPENMLTEEECCAYRAEINSILKYIDDDVVMHQKNIWMEHKAYILTNKHGRCPEKFWIDNRLLFAYQNIGRFSLENFPITLEFVTLTKENITIEGWIPHYLYLDTDSPDLIVKANGIEIVPELFDRPEKILFAEEEIVARKGFRFTVSFNNLERVCLRFYCKTIFGDVWIKRLRYGKYFAINDQLHSNYYWKDGRKLTGNKVQLNIVACGRKGMIKSELALLRELWKLKRKGYRKAVFGRVFSHIYSLLQKKQVWLICDKADRADDNGEAFFQYMQTLKNTRRDIKTYFLLEKGSPDYQRLSQIGKVIPYMSWRHKLLYLVSSYVISAYSHDEINNPFIGYHTPYRDMMQKCKYIFLQHGITKDDVSKGLNRSHKNISGFITSTWAERQSILNTPEYLYRENEVWLTGLPRYDRLYHAEERSIVIMPTWRRSLFGDYHAKDSRWDLKPGFEESVYYQFYTALLNNNRLLEGAKRLNFKINFVPHPILFPYIDRFSIPEDVKLWGINVVYRDMFAKNKLLITDYSSVAFDFAYLRKPVVYVHFDQNHYAEGYFDYERDGFGEVEYDLEGAVNRIIEYMENDCKLKTKFHERIDSFFTFNDKNNCQRVYEEIMKLEEQRPYA